MPTSPGHIKKYIYIIIEPIELAVTMETMDHPNIYIFHGVCTPSMFAARGFSDKKILVVGFAAVLRQHDSTTVLA